MPTETPPARRAGQVECCFCMATSSASSEGSEPVSQETVVASASRTHRGSWVACCGHGTRSAPYTTRGIIEVVTKPAPANEAITERFDDLLDPAGNHLKILIDLNR